MLRWTFQTLVFARWARRERLTDRALLEAVAEMESGLIDARLGGGLFKKRDLKRIAGVLLRSDWTAIGKMLETGRLLEVKDG